jgi:histone-lysine N-methyltransferase SETMAR
MALYCSTHDNACPHTAANTAETLKKLNFEVMEHPPCSPDLAPSDYHLFGPLKQVLRGRRFTTDQQLKETVACLSAQNSILRA